MHAVDKAFRIFSEVIYIVVYCRIHPRKTTVTVKEKNEKKIACMLFVVDGVHVVIIFIINIKIDVLLKL